MASKIVYDYLAQWLCDSMAKVYEGKFSYMKDKLKGFGAYDKKYSLYKQKALRRMVEDSICWQEDAQHLLVGTSDRLLYAFNGKWYERIKEKPEEFLEQLIIRAFRQLGVGDFYIQELPALLGKACLRTLRSCDSYNYEPNKRYAAFNNGVLDLWNYPAKDSFKERFDCKYKPWLTFNLDYATKDAHRVACNKKYGYGDSKSTDNPNPCNLIDRILGGWDEKESIDARCIFPMGAFRRRVQMFCGALLLDRQKTKFEYMCVIQGPGANGKSVFVDAISGLFDPALVSHFSPEQLFRSNHSQFNMAMMDGKILNVMGDLNDADYSGGDLKRVVSGEKMEASKKYENAKEILPPLMLGCTNHDPASRDTSWGHYRRFLLVKTTTRQFNGDERDPELTAKLSTNDAKLWLLHWVLEGYVKLMKAKGKIDEDDEDMRKVREQMMLNDSTSRQFAAFGQYEACAEGEGEMRKFKDMYAEYRAWCGERGFDKPDDFKRFNSILRDMGFVGKEERMGYFWHVKAKVEDEN